MATISNTPRPGYVWDATDNVWYPIGVGGHGHPDYITQATAVNPTIIDAKGDILTATAADTPARLAVGANDTVLTADSSTATGLKWATPAGGGKLLQMQAGSTTGQLITSSATYADTGLTVTITPSSATSKIFIQGSFNYRKSNGAAGNRANIRIMRGATQVYEDTDQLWTDTAIYNNSNYCLSYLDSPATTSATTYKVQMANPNATAQVLFNYSALTVNIYATEIGA
jgi:hypothetical protein